MLKFIIDHNNNYYDLYEFILKDDRVLHIPAPIFNEILEDIDKFILQHITVLKYRNAHTFKCPICGDRDFYAGVCEICKDEMQYERNKIIADILWQKLEEQNKITDGLREIKKEEKRLAYLIFRLERRFTEEEIKEIEKTLNIDYTYWNYTHKRYKDRIKKLIMKYFGYYQYCRPSWIKEINYITNSVEENEKEENNNIE